MAVRSKLHNGHAEPPLFRTAELSYPLHTNGSNASHRPDPSRHGGCEKRPSDRPEAPTSIDRPTSAPRTTTSGAFLLPRARSTRTNLLPVRPGLSSARRILPPAGVSILREPDRREAHRRRDLRAWPRQRRGASLPSGTSSRPPRRVDPSISLQGFRSGPDGAGVTRIEQLSSSQIRPHLGGPDASPGLSYSADEIRTRPNFISVTA
jgi:hypothetical protein